MADKKELVVLTAQVSSLVHSRDFKGAEYALLELAKNGGGDKEVAKAMRQLPAP